MKIPGRLLSRSLLTSALCLSLVPLARPVRAVSTTLVVNEIDYDQPGTDAAEFLELKNVSSSSIDLTGYSVELVNGNAGGAVVYQTINLPSVAWPPAATSSSARTPRTLPTATWT
jgi:hypothetical protein